MTRGFADEGFNLVGAVENDFAAAATYAANFGESHTQYIDIADYDDVPDANVVIGGPPCQGFSNLGKRDPTDSRNSLWREFVRVVVAADCDIFVLENVERFGSSLEYLLLRAETVRGDLEEFSLETFTLNAADYGVPQRRIRRLVVGSRVGPIGEPTATHADKPSDSEERWTTVRDAFAGLAFDAALPTDLPERNAEFFGGELPGVFTLDEIHVGRTYQKKSIQRYRLIAPGRSRLDLPEELMYECWKTHNTGARDVLGRLEWDKPSLTIRTEFFKPEKGRYLHPEWNGRGRRVNRAISHAEAARLQGFDERHVWCGSKVEIARQIGNAVPPPLAAAVARAVRRRLSHPEQVPASKSA